MGLGPPARDSESSSESFLVTFYCQSLRRSVPPPWHRDNHGRKLAAITAAANLKLMVAQCQTSSQCQTSESLCRGPGHCAAVTVTPGTVPGPPARPWLPRRSESRVGRPGMSLPQEHH